MDAAYVPEGRLQCVCAGKTGRGLGCMASRSLERGCRAVRVLNGCLLGVPVRHLLHEESYRCLAPPRNTTNKEHLKINPNDRQSTKLTDQALGTTERAA